MDVDIVINIKTKMEKQVLIYKLEGIDPKNGIDIFEIIPTLENLGLLVKEAGKISLEVDDLEVKVKPFKEGSFEIDLLLKSTVNLFNGPEVSAAINIITLLGLGYGTIKFVKGKVNQFKKTKNNITYYSEDGFKLEVDKKTHDFIQNEAVQKAISGSIATPIQNIDGVNGISLQTDGYEERIHIDREDLDLLETYSKIELEDESKNIENRAIIYVKPARGSYSGEEKQYTFIAGKDNKLYPTTIQDESFIKKLKSGEVRLFHEDVLLVQMLSKQKISRKTGKLSNEYIIEKVLEYNDDFGKIEQSSFDF